MKRFFEVYGRFVSTKPWMALGLVAVLTVVAVYGMSVSVDQDEAESSFLPSGSELVDAQEALDESFPQFSALENVQVILRGDVLTPGGMADSIAANQAAVAELEPYLVEERRPVSVGGIMLAMIAGAGDRPVSIDAAGFTQADISQINIGAVLAGIAQADIDAALSAPENAALVASLEGLVARDDSGNVIGGVGSITVNGAGHREALAEAQLAADDAVKDVQLQALDSARTFSRGKLAADSDSSGALSVLMVVALVVIALLLVLFYRQASDVVFTMAGLGLTILWAIGFQGVLGPDGLGVVGAPSVMGQMVPIVMIGLCVDYGIQVTSRYREACADGNGSSASGGISVAAVMLPLGLAGSTTIISFLTNITAEIDGMADFGIVAGVGVASGLVIFLTAVPAARVIWDRRREAKGKELSTRLMNEGIPGAGKLVEAISSVSVARPAAILIVVAVFTVVMGVLATQVKSEFKSEDFVSSGSESSEDLDFLNDSLGGSTEPVTVLVEADITSDRTLRNLLDLSTGLEDPVLRPNAVASSVTSSLGVLAASLSPEATAEIAALDVGTGSPLVISPEVIQEALDIMESYDPEGFASVVAYGGPGEPDRTIVQFDALSSDQKATSELVDDIEGLWLGPDDEVTAISNQVTGLVITNSLEETQAQSIFITIIAALIVLLMFFWATEFRPMLAVLAVLPIVLVLVWVIGTMTILGYSYNVITALITALSIGIGVDYTIHVTHRFLEEREHGAHTLGDAVSKVMRTTGGALIGSALTTVMGFLVLVFAPVPPMGQFGVLTAITVAFSLIAAIIVLPPMLVIWAAYHDWRSNHLTGLEKAQAAEAAAASS